MGLPGVSSNYNPNYERTGLNTADISRLLKTKGGVDKIEAGGSNYLDQALKAMKEKGI